MKKLLNFRSYKKRLLTLNLNANEKKTQRLIKKNVWDKFSIVVFNCE